MTWRLLFNQWCFRIDMKVLDVIWLITIRRRAACAYSLDEYETNADIYYLMLRSRSE